MKFDKEGRIISFGDESILADQEIKKLIPTMNMSDKETKVQYTKIFQATILIILNLVQAGTLLIIANLLSQILNLLNQLNV